MPSLLPSSTLFSPLLLIFLKHVPRLTTIFPSLFFSPPLPILFFLPCHFPLHFKGWSDWRVQFRSVCASRNSTPRNRRGWVRILRRITRYLNYPNSFCFALYCCIGLCFWSNFWDMTQRSLRSNSSPSDLSINFFPLIISLISSLIIPPFLLTHPDSILCSYPTYNIRVTLSPHHRTRTRTLHVVTLPPPPPPPITFI